MLLGAKTATRYELLAEIARLRSLVESAEANAKLHFEAAEEMRAEVEQLRAARLRPETVDAAKLALSLRESSMQNIRHLVPKEINNVAAALADLNRAYPEED